MQEQQVSTLKLHSDGIEELKSEVRKRLEKSMRRNNKLMKRQSKM